MATKNEKIVGTYKTLDNGGYPFKCIIYENNTVNVHKGNYLEEEGDVSYEKEVTYKFDAKDVFIGKSPLNKMTKFSGGHGDEWDGNSILLDMGDNEYIFIGDKIFSFDAKAKITDFVSPVGNSAVPYPYATDELKNYYLIVYDEVVLHSAVIAEKMKLYDNPYDLSDDKKDLQQSFKKLVTKKTYAEREF